MSAQGERTPVDVAVGVLVDADGRFLLTSRPPGKVYAGFIHSQSDQDLTLKTIEGNFITLPKKQIVDQVKQTKSLMPELVLKSVTAQDAADLLAYLASLQSRGKLSQATVDELKTGADKVLAALNYRRVHGGVCHRRGCRTSGTASSAPCSAPAARRPPGAGSGPGRRRAAAPPP